MHPAKSVVQWYRRRLHSTGKKRSLNICRFKGILNHQFALEGYNANDQDYREIWENFSKAEEFVLSTFFIYPNSEAAGVFVRRAKRLGRFVESWLFVLATYYAAVFWEKAEK